MALFKKKPEIILDETVTFEVIPDAEERDEQIINENSVDTAILRALGIGTGTVTFEQALQIPAVAASIDFISSICARVPVELFTEDGEDTEKVTDDARIRLLNGDTGDLLNAYQMKKAWIKDYFDGRGYIYINTELNRVKSLHYIEKQYIQVYKYDDPIYKDADIYVSGTVERRLMPFNFLRLCRNTKDGVTGESIIDSNDLLLSLYYDTMKYEKHLMNTGGNKKGFLTSEKKLGEEALAKMRYTWNEVFNKNAENMMVLNNGIKFQEASATSTELQLNENKKTNSDDVMLLFLLSQAALQGASDDEIVSAVKTACIPIIEQMEAAYNTGLLLEEEKGHMYFACDTSKIERGDILKRYQAYEIGLKNNFLQPDEVRYEEDKKPLGLNFIKLGLDDVLYNPETGEIYTPNTNQSVQMNEQRDSDDYIQDPETGLMQGRQPSGNSNNSGLTDSSESGIVNVTIDNASKENITIDKRKLTEYALNPEKQPEKAEAFQKALGYNLSNYQELDNKIRDNFDKDKLIKTETTEFGTKYKQTMRITGPNQKTAKVLTAWIDSTSDSDNKDFHLTSVYVDK
ncbi:MAG: phage portal protein [Ruminococcus sp.]|nr:phage portal protein [Ruminococcus sp.]